MNVVSDLNVILRCIDQNETDRLDTQARSLKKKYFSRRYLFGPTSPIDEETQNKVIFESFISICYFEQLFLFRY